MKTLCEVVVVSGKGGTGKTSVIASLARLMTDKVVADCDVDAANLSLVLHSHVIEERGFTGGKKATIILDKCIQCNRCRETCRFSAIGNNFVVDTLTCEGCGACYFLCPVEAVAFEAHRAGACFLCETDSKEPFIYAELVAGEDNSGKLVAMVRATAKEQAETKGISRILIDGPPGIGCPVISSLTGTSLAVIVTEPTSSGIHDLERILALAGHFQTSTAVVINKSDIDSALSDTIETYCREKGVSLLGRIPYEKNISEAQRAGKTIVEYSPESKASHAMRHITDRLESILKGVNT